MGVDNQQQVDVLELLSSEPQGSYCLYDPLAPRLPLHQMPWEDFERLCAYLIKAGDATVVQAFRYGSPQQGQGGIDILATLNSSGKALVAQCKRVRRVRRNDILRWVADFLGRKEPSDIGGFILAVTFDIESDRKLIDEWRSAAKLLSEAQVHSELWDLRQIDESLRTAPQVVARFFGHENARRFCPKAVPHESWPSEYRKQALSVHDTSVVLENRSVRLDMFVPSEREPHVSAALSFARADLSGISLAIDGGTLVRWLQWMAHSSSLRNAPFLPRLPRESRFILQAPTARLQMDVSEVDDLQWILREAWMRYIAAAQLLEDRWRALRFPLLGEKSRCVFGLCKVERWFWRAILAYAAEHDFDKGNSASHIFDGGAACLKIYVRDARAGLLPGYHLIAYASSDDNHTLWDGGVTVGWQQLPAMGGHPPTYSPAMAWDAEYTHDWLMNSLCPAVLAWTSDRERENRGLLAKLRTRMSGPVARKISLDEVAHSRAQMPYSSTALRLMSLSEAIAIARALQTHFTIYDSEAPLESALRRGVLELVRDLLPPLEQPEHGYVRGKLGIESGSLSDGVARLLMAEMDGVTTHGELDMALRSLIALLEDSSALSSRWLDLASHKLEPLWRRCREDRICGVYR